MFKKLITLEWKQFIRSSYFQRSIILNILLIFVALYFMASFAFLGIGMYFLLEKSFPKEDPLVVVNNYLVFWFLIDIIYRFFLQKLPVINIKPLMGQPIKRKAIIHFLLAKTTFSFYNLLPLFFFLPFSAVLLYKGYPPVNVIFWFVAMLFFELSVNYLNFLINKKEIVFYTVFTLLVVMAGIQYFEVYDLTTPIGYFFNTIYNKAYAFLIPVCLAFLLYRKNYAFIRSDFYIDGKISKTTKKIKTSELSWMDRFGKSATFLKNDLRMIWRNKRPRKMVLMSVVFLLYGLIFYPSEVYQNMAPALVFASIFITGGFLFSFGQLVPSWDSQYYKLLMSQNIPYRQYLESKWALMATATFIALLLSTPYIYFGWDIYGMIVAGAFFNIGLNTFITLYAGALNRVPVKLNEKSKAFGNTQGFNITQMLFILPKMVLPVLLFYIPYKLINLEAGLLVLGLSGIIGFLFKNYFFNLIEKIYQKGKYKTIKAFDEDH